MRTLVIMVAMFGLLGAEAKAADDFMIKLADDRDSNQVFLFQPKKSNVFIKTNVEDFCHVMKYGEFVDGRSTEIVEDHKAVTVVDWVICRIPGKTQPEKKPKCDPECKQK